MSGRATLTRQQDRVINHRRSDSRRRASKRRVSRQTYMLGQVRRIRSAYGSGCHSRSKCQGIPNSSLLPWRVRRAWRRYRYTSFAGTATRIASRRITRYERFIRYALIRRERSNYPYYYVNVEYRLSSGKPNNRLYQRESRRRSASYRYQIRGVITRTARQRLASASNYRHASNSSPSQRI